MAFSSLPMIWLFACIYFLLYNGRSMEFIRNEPQVVINHFHPGPACKLS